MSSKDAEDRRRSSGGPAKVTRREFLRRAAALGVSSVAVASGLAACAPAAAPTPTPAPVPTPTPVPPTPTRQPVKIRSGFAIAPHMALQTVAATKGWFKEKNLDVEIIAFDAGAPLFEAMAAGKVEVGHTGSTPIFAVHITGTVPIYFIGTHGEATPIFKILSRKKFQSPADLKGTVGIMAKGSVNHYFCLLMLQKYGLTEKDVTIVHMDYADHVSAFVGGNGDFISTGTNFWPQIIAQATDAKILFDGTMLDQPPNPIKEKMFETTTVKREFADKNPDAVVAYVDVLFDRTHQYFMDPATKAQAHQDLHDWLRANVNFGAPLQELTDMLNQVNYPTAAQQVEYFRDGTFKASFQHQIQFLAENGKIAREFPFEEMTNSSFVEAAAAM